MVEPTGPNPNPFAEDIEAAVAPKAEAAIEADFCVPIDVVFAIGEGDDAVRHGRGMARTAGSPEGAIRVIAGEHKGSGPAEADPACACLWCGAALPSASHPGSERRFCSSKCRQALHAACRSWAVQAVYAGRLSLDAVRNASQKACTFATAAKPGSEVVE